MSVLRWAARLTAATTFATALVGLTGTAPAVAEDPLPNPMCGVLQDFEETWVCVTLSPENAVSEGPDFPIRIPAICPFVACTPEVNEDVPNPVIASGAQPIIVIEYSGRTYEFTTNPFQILSEVIGEVVDPIACRILRVFFPPEGDVGTVVNCPTP